MLTGLILTLTACSTVNTSDVPLTPADMLAAARAEITEVSPQQGQVFASGAVVVDVREPAEFAGGHLPDAINIPRGTLEWRIARAGQLKTLNEETRYAHPILVYCKSGARAALATQTLQRMGYQNVQSIEGGYVAWEKAGLPIANKPEKAD